LGVTHLVGSNLKQIRNAVRVALMVNGFLHDNSPKKKGYGFALFCFMLISKYMYDCI